MLSISTAVIKEEFNLVQRILTKWQQRFDEGVPGVDIPAEDYATDLFVRELVGELMVVAGTMENMASILAEDRNG